MNRFRQIVSVVLAVLVPCLFGGGCASSSLWEKKTWRGADDPGLSLSLDPKLRDILVQYDEVYEGSPKVRRRAYWLFASNHKVMVRSKPDFIKPKALTGLTPIPLLEEAPATNAPNVSGYAAVMTPWRQGFDLSRDGEPQGRYYLPVYVEGPRASVWRIVATPFAALGDTMVVVLTIAGTVAVVAGLAYLESMAK